MLSDLELEASTRLLVEDATDQRAVGALAAEGVACRRPIRIGTPTRIEEPRGRTDSGIVVAALDPRGRRLSNAGTLGFMIRRADEPRNLEIDGEVSQILESADRDGPVGPLLDSAVPTNGADHGTVHSGDGMFTASIPLVDLRRGEIVDGRLHLDDPPTRCWLVKDVVRIELTAGKQPDSVAAKERARKQ